MPGGVLEREFTNRWCERTYGRRSLHGKGSQCVVACVGVRPISSEAPAGSVSLDPKLLYALAVQRVERALRPDDLICPMGSGRIAVCFGYGAHLTRISSLGMRLASATGDQISIDSHGLELQVAVGVSRGPASRASEVTMAAIAASGACHELLRRTGASHNGSNGSSNGSVSSHANGVVVVHVAARPGLSLHRREVISPRQDRHSHTSNGSGELRFEESGPRTSDLSVLVVGLNSHGPGKPDPAVEALLSTARRNGVAAKVAVEGAPSEVLEGHERTREEVVVLALGPEPVAQSRLEGAITPWETWGHLVRELVRSGTTVLAVRAGGSVAAVAMCVREGAIGLLDLGEFAEQLEKINVNLAIGRLAAENGARELPRGWSRGALPSPYNKLVGLTSSEHRVLYQMMRGASASEIAEALIVSLATVRSHIRSILRKLEVSSQLAAVALANGSRQGCGETL